jgi:hypothetical protein
VILKFPCKEAYVFQFCDATSTFKCSSDGKRFPESLVCIVVAALVIAVLAGCGAKGQAEVPPWPGSALPAGSFCRRQVADSFDDL